MRRTSHRLFAPLAGAMAGLAMMGLAQAPATSPSATPPSAAPDPTGSAVVQVLLVIGRYPGPALWTVQRGEGTVVVLGGLSPLPHMLQWDTHRLEHAMDGADLVLLPPTGRLGPLDLVYILFHAGDLRLSGGRTLWDELSPEQKARFENLRLQVKQPTKRYKRLKPGIAGFILASDFEKAAGLSSAKPGSTVKDLAEAHHIRTRPEGGIPVAEVFKAAVGMNERQGLDCLDAMLTEIEHQASRARPMADAWANGDLKVLKAEYRTGGIESCLAGAPGLQAFGEKLTRDATTSIDQALSRGGKTVAVVDLRLLLRANGVLDRLQAAGATVKVPRD